MILDLVSANVGKAPILGNTCDCNGKKTERIYDIKKDVILICILLHLFAKSAGVGHSGDQQARK